MSFKDFKKSSRMVPSVDYSLRADSTVSAEELLLFALPHLLLSLHAG